MNYKFLLSLAKMCKHGNFMKNGLVAVDALNAFLRQIGDPMKFLTGNWTGDDPCGSSWLGVYCNQTQRVHELYVFLSSNYPSSLDDDRHYNGASLH